MKGLKVIPFAAALLSFVLLPGCGGDGTFSPQVSTVGQVTPVTVTVSPSSVDMLTGDSRQFSVTVTGTPNHGVTWTLSSNLQGGDPGTISSSGLYRSPSFISSVRVPGATSETVTVTATSVADPNATGTATINLTQRED